MFIKRYSNLIWISVSFIGLTAAIVLSPSWLLSRLPPQAKEFYDQLVQGITLVRVGLAASGLLALVSARFWRFGVSPRSQILRVRPARQDYIIGSALLVLSALLMVPSLATSFWWDELTTLVKVVQRGPLVILSWSCSANNHVLNSLLMWIIYSTLGEGEIQLRLPAFLLGLATPLAIYWCLIERWGRWRAALAAFLAASHLWVVVHGVEARGYSGAILFCFLACIFYAEIIQQSSTRYMALYVLCAVIAFGFIATTILVPLAHGMVASALYLHQLLAGRRRSAQASRYLNVIIICLWVGVLALIFFGLPAPQTLEYAAQDAGAIHMHLGFPLLMKTACYLTSSQDVLIALTLVLVSLVGWAMCRHDIALCLAFLTPALVAACQLALPGTYASPRLYCFLIIPFVMGLTTSFRVLYRMNGLARVAAVCFVIIWLASAGSLHWRFLTIGNPDLKSLNSRIGAARVVLTGAQADVNTYYFSNAKLVKPWRGAPLDLEELRDLDADYIVIGYLDINGINQTANLLLSHGYECFDRMDSWTEDRIRYIVYRRCSNLHAE